MGKYRARKVKEDGITFDSRAEHARYLELRLLERSGHIQGLQVHPRFILQEKFTAPDGEKVRAITHAPDFQYDEEGVTVVEDVKGVVTADFRLRYRLFRARYPQISYRVVKV